MIKSNKTYRPLIMAFVMIVVMLMPQGAWAGACAYTPGCASIEDMQVHLNGTNGNFNGSANNEVVASLKFNYSLEIFNYDGDNGYWDRDLTMKIDGQTLTFYSDYACTTKVSTDYSTVLQGVWGVFGDSNEDHTIGKNKSGSGNKAYFMTSSGLKGYINIYNYYAASNKWTTMKVEVFIYDLYGHKVSVCGTYKRKGKSDIAYDYVFYLGGCPRPKNVTTSQSTTKKEVTISWQKETYSIPASDATGEIRVKAYNVIDNGSWGVYRNNNYNTSIQTVGNTTTSAADNSASCSSSPYTYNVCYEPKATYGSNSKSLTGSETSKRGISGSKSITLTHVWSNSGSLKDAATCTAAAVYYQKCIYCGSTSDANHTYTSGSALGHGSTGYTDSYSWTGNAYNDASQDTKACTFTLTCKKCSTKVVNGASLTCTKTAHVDALCTATGSTTYQATGSYTAANSAYNYSATKTNVYTVAALGHGTTGYTPTYTWGGTYDDATCTFTLQCGSCGAEVFNDNITTTKVPHNYVDVTCGKDGNIRWTATGSYSKAGDATYNGEAQVKDYAIPATGLHTFADDDLAQSVCTVCNHGFFRYTAMAKVEPKKPAELKNAEGMSIYNADKHSFADGMGVMEFDEPLVTIGQLAFLNGFDFTENLTIPNTVTTIGHGAFQSCFRLTGNLIIPNSVTSIGPIAFDGCRFSGNLILPNSVTSIGSDAFYGCNFNNITLQSIPNVKDRAFSHNVGYDEENDIAIYINFPITISLSDNSYVYTGENPDFPEVQSVTYNRSMQNAWGTVVVPFAITYSQSNGNYKLYRYTAATVDAVANTGTLTFTEYDDQAVIPAGTPMIIKAVGSKNAETGKYNVLLTANGNDITTTINAVPAVDGLTLEGTYEIYEDMKCDAGADVYFIAQNKFWKAVDGITIHPFRAWFMGSIAGAPAYFEIMVADEEESSGIDELKAESGMLKEGKFMENGRVVIYRNGVKYSITGFR